MQARLGLGRSVVDADRIDEPDNRAGRNLVAAPAGSHVCPVCGELVRAADLGAALFHQRPNHKAGDRRR